LATRDIFGAQGARQSPGRRGAILLAR